ncbi:RHS repeat protein [Lampropedia aestuarii]|uniref:RHS repeat protein n=1 Tax=Lampropedia aestuarii TaxID=2562762 RepID=A0A4S5BFU6_9BURK|nr:RHS repeat-associated core domain-containing protein [Lampropedia aestuarii]THJ31120.1 RHS repeat protein [Lampropedia aestuarii]
MAVVPESIHLATGCVSLSSEDDVDFFVDGIFAFSWQRSYRSRNAHVGLLGQGWSLPLMLSVELGDDELVFIDQHGRRIAFPALNPGQSFYSRYEKITLLCTGEHYYDVLTPEGGLFQFGLAKGQPAAVGQRLSLQAMQDANRNALSIDYAAEGAEKGLPIAVRGFGGDWLSLSYIHIPNVGPRLHKVQKLAETPSLRMLDEPSSLERYLRRRAPDDGVAQSGHAHSHVLIEYRYDDAGELSQVIDGRGQLCRSFQYASQQLIAHRYSDGRIVQYEWDQRTPQGRVVRMYKDRGSSAEHAWQFKYDIEARSVQVIEMAANGLRRQSQYVFDADQHLIATQDAAGTTTKKRNRFGDLLSQTDPLGHTTRYEYDHLSRLTHITTPDGATQSTSWHATLHKPLTITDPLGRTSRFIWDFRGNLLQSIDAAGHSTSYSYDRRGLPTTITDALGKTKQLQYNARGQLIHYTDCSGQPTAFSWDEEGNLLSSTDALGQTTTYTYERINRQQRLVMQQLADGSIERFAYDAAGRLTTHQDALGNITRYQLDAEGKPLARTNALGHSLRYQYDGFGRLTRLTNENGAHYRFAWDLLDQLQAEQGFDGRRIDYRYNAAGQLLEMADGQAPGSRWMANNPTSSPANIRTHYQRDAMGRLLQRQVHKQGHGLQRTRYQYDAAGQLTIARNQHARVQLVYTALGQIASEILHTQLGQHSTLAHQYDALGNRTSTSLPDGRTINTLHYGSGHVHQINIDGEVICDMERDALHRETQRSQGAISSHYQLDALGRLLASHSSLGPSLKPTQPPSAQNTTSGQQIARRYQYDEAGQLLRIEDSRHGSTRYQYDAIGRLTQALAGRTHERFAFDPAHNLIDPAQAQTQAKPNGTTAADTNSLQERRDTDWAQYVQAHINDPDFNPLQAPDAAQETEPTNPEGWTTTSDNRLKVWQEHRYQYDQWGNCIEKKSGPRQVQHFSWDAEHQLSSARTEHHGQQEGQQHTWHYAYDPFGRRIAKWQEHTKTLAGKHKKPHPEHITHFSWDGNRLLAEYKQERRRSKSKEESSIRHRLYLYEPESFVPLAQIDSTWAKDKETRDAPLSNPFLQQITQEAQNDPAIWSGKVLPFQRKLQAKLKAQGIAPDKPKETSQSTTLYYHNDHLGTPRELTNREGDIIWAATYKAWGNTESIEYPKIRQTTQSGNTLQERWVDQEVQDKPQQHLRFQGQYFDAETGLHYNRFRYYDPDCGRFVSQDPIGLYGGDNLYQYAPNPTGWTDFYGLSGRKTSKPRIEPGNSKEGWMHIDERHITGNSQQGPGDLFPPGTTQDQIQCLCELLVKKGTRITDPSRRIQTFEIKTKVNGLRARFRGIFDSKDQNRTITTFPVLRE